MASCLKFEYTTCDTTCGDAEPIVYAVYSSTGKTLEACGVADLDENVMLTKLEYAETSANSSAAIEAVFNEYFGFDAGLFSELLGWMLLIYVIGFGVGRTLSILNLSNRNYS